MQRGYSHILALTGKELENLCKGELDPDVKEKLLHVLKIEGDGMVPARVAKELHRSRTWASDWLARYHEGVDGLGDRPRSGRPPRLPAEMAVRIRKRLKESKHGWITEQVNDMIVKEGGVQYHYHHVFKLLHKWGFKQKVPRKVHANTASPEEKEAFKKERRKS